ncbi:MAG TPA: UvrD-helicase domain-containing protein [Nitrospirales bacterium]|jgi:ATP-dependent helicase/nuclease subunit A
MMRPTRVPDTLILRDADARLSAATTFDRNIVVTASAGTGKTTLLVDRLLQLLMKSPDPVSLSEIVALTFMEKAAHEMKVRLRERLLDLRLNSEACGALAAANRVSPLEIRTRAERALEELERSQIGTIHSFAAHLIRSYPIEAGVDPRFEPDDGSGFERHFERDWQEWLQVELGSLGERHEIWKRVLRRTSLESLRELATKLTKDLVPLPLMMAQMQPGSMTPVLKNWLGKCLARTRVLLMGERHREREPRQVEKLLDVSAHLFELVLTGGLEAISGLSQDSRILLQTKDPGSKPPGQWDEQDFAEAITLIETAKALLKTDHEYLAAVLTILIPFAEGCRRRFLEAGRIGFDGLLARARALIKSHPQVRRRLKQQFKAVLVDEFQDTDPVQYEILLFLCERSEDAAASWQEVRLEPGKLFIVGDPKQSIFAFRRADIEAFQQVTDRVVSQGGMALTLTTNFRSHASIISCINGLFSRLISEQPGLQPAYHPLEPQPDRTTCAGMPGVELRLVAQDDESNETDELSAEEAMRSEAEAVARWVKQEIVGKEVLIDRDGRRRKAAPGDVALLFRTFSQGRHYLDALRRHGLAYLAEGEKHFYQRQEVIDFVNLLRCIQNPDDAVARLGLMRSPLGGLSDGEVRELTALGALDYRQGAHARLDEHPKAAHLHRLYAVLQMLHEDCPRRPLPSALDLIFERLPVLELAAASAHGEQAMANLWKVRGLTDELVGDPALTLAGFAELLSGRIVDPPDESETGLAEDSSEAVRVLTIHKAKGLEFPIVVLVGLQAGTPTQFDSIEVHHDWSTDVVGLRFEGISTLEGIFTAEKLSARMTSEQRRLLYVGMTRAKERLVLSGALSRRPASGNFLALCREAIGESLGKEDCPVLEAGDGRIIQTILPPDEGRLWTWKPAARPAEPVPDMADFVPRWHKREEAYRHRRDNPIIVTASSLAVKTRVAGQGSSSQTSAMIIGSIMHTILNKLTYTDKLKPTHQITESALGLELPEELYPEREAILADLQGMLSTFIQSDMYADLCGSTIVAREIPFLMPFCFPSGHLPTGLMEGRIDLLYRKDGRLWIADYKTDRVSEAEMAERAQAYGGQARHYMQAVAQGFGEPPAGFKFIFLRLGKVAEVLFPVD